MSAEHVAELYMQLDHDPNVRSRIAAGDPSAFGGEGALSDYERRLLIDAANDEWPDVTGFSTTPVTIWAPYRYITTQYVLRSLTSDVSQATFSRYLNSAGVNPEG
jgi:hypothetical protein